MQILHKKAITNFGIAPEMQGTYHREEFVPICRIYTSAVSGKHPEPNK
jgi:hypothetical protein